MLEEEGNILFTFYILYFLIVVITLGLTSSTYMLLLLYLHCIVYFKTSFRGFSF